MSFGGGGGGDSFSSSCRSSRVCRVFLSHRMQRNDLRVRIVEIPNHQWLLRLHSSLPLDSRKQMLIDMHLKTSKPVWGGVLRRAGQPKMCSARSLLWGSDLQEEMDPVVGHLCMQVCIFYFLLGTAALLTSSFSLLMQIYVVCMNRISHLCINWLHVSSPNRCFCCWNRNHTCSLLSYNSPTPNGENATWI